MNQPFTLNDETRLIALSSFRGRLYQSLINCINPAVTASLERPGAHWTVPETNSGFSKLRRHMMLAVSDIFARIVINKPGPKMNEALRGPFMAALWATNELVPDPKSENFLKPIQTQLVYNLPRVPQCITQKEMMENYGDAVRLIGTQRGLYTHAGQEEAWTRVNNLICGVEKGVIFKIKSVPYHKQNIDQIAPPTYI
jgi:hypothetical protein